jgi:chromosomal replication initiation ATPase DnaA
VTGAPVMPPRVLELVRQVAGERRLPLREVLTTPKRRAQSRARWEVWAMLREETPQPTLPRIARWFGVDHTTVLYGVRRHHGLPGKLR